MSCFPAASCAHGRGDCHESNIPPLRGFGCTREERFSVRSDHERHAGRNGGGHFPDLHRGPGTVERLADAEPHSACRDGEHRGLLEAGMEYSRTETGEAGFAAFEPTACEGT